MSINKAFAVSIEANRKKTGNAKGSSFMKQKGFQIVTRSETQL